MPKAATPVKASLSTAVSSELNVPAFLLRKKGKTVKASREADRVTDFEALMETSSVLPEKLEWRSVWFLYGPDMREKGYRDFEYFVKDPPYSGFGEVFVIRGEKRSTVFCPYSFQSWAIPNVAAELMKSADKADSFRRDFIVEHIYRKWEMYHVNSMQVDFDVAASILSKLGAKVPTVIELSPERKAELARLRPEKVKKEGPSGGKAVADKVIRQVSKTSKRGKVLEFFLVEGENKPRSIREAMSEFDTTRSNILSTLFILNKDHGLGYVLKDDAASVQLPKGKLWE